MSSQPLRQRSLHPIAKPTAFELAEEWWPIGMGLELTRAYTVILRVTGQSALPERYHISVVRFQGLGKLL